MTEEKYRKILDGVMEQAEKDFGEDINVPNKIELSDEEIVKALYICTTADDDMDCIDDCPMYEEDYCTTKLLKMAFDFIHRLHETIDKQKAELEKLHTLTDMQEANVNTLFENNMGLRKEIEQFTTRCEIAEGTKNRLTIFDRIEIHDKAVKDTAREILQYVGDLYDDGDQRFQLKDYQWHKNLCKKYGVEVE